MKRNIALMAWIVFQMFVVVVGFYKFSITKDNMFLLIGIANSIFTLVNISILTDRLKK